MQLKDLKPLIEMYPDAMLVVERNGGLRVVTGGETCHVKDVIAANFQQNGVGFVAVHPFTVEIDRTTREVNALVLR